MSKKEAFIKQYPLTIEECSFYKHIPKKEREKLAKEYEETGRGMTTKELFMSTEQQKLSDEIFGKNKPEG